MKKSMRDYPSVPNVFRVASSHSINNESTFAPPSSLLGSNCSSAIGANSNLSPIRVRQQQPQQQQQQQQNQISNGQHKSEQQQPKQQYHEEQPLRSATEMVQSNRRQTHKLTTTASIERNYQNGGFGRREQHSPYATLPRSMPGVSSISDLRHSPPPTEHNSRNGNIERGSGEHSATAVINTISGSIPCAKFTKARATSMGSDLNKSMNTSCTDLTKLNELQQQATHVHRTTRTEVTSDYSKRSNSCTKKERHNGGYLWILTPVAASISVAIVIAALAGPQWLFTEEKLPNANYNGTANFNVLDDGAFITKFTKSSLWILCSTLQGIETYNCIKIDYFPMEGYQPDPNDSTPAIPYTVTKSCPFFLASGIFLLISFTVFLIPTCSHQNNLYYFSAGIMFIVSGLLMLIGLIAYISILKAEIGSKLRSRSTLQPALFKVTYGQSFFLFVFGFIATEFVGLLNIFLYISLQEVGYYSRLPCFTISNLHEKIKEGENPRSHTYKSYKHATGWKSPPISQHPKNKNNKNNLHQVHDINQATEVDDYENRKLLQQLPISACRKHPNATNANLFLNNNLERKLFFEKPVQSKCSLHSKNLAKSLNELYTEPAPPVGPPPPPSSIKVGRTQTLQTAQFIEIPQEFPLTRSVSTTTDIFANGKGNDNSRVVTPCFERKNNRRNIATNTYSFDRGTDEQEWRNEALHHQEKSVPNIFAKDVDEDEPEQRLCGLKRGTRKTKDELFLEFCKRAGVRPKPKNIYYITNEEEEKEKHRRRIGMNAVRCGEEELEADNDNEEESFKQLLDDEDHIFVMGDNPNYSTNIMRNYRRASMYVEPMHLRKLNSNHSLHTLFPPDISHGKMNNYDPERYDSATNLWQLPPDYETCYNKNGYGGSHLHLHHRDYNPQIYQSRTLPRSFLKRNTDSQDSIASTSFHASTTALHNAYDNATQNQHLTRLLLLQQQQFLQQNPHQHQKSNLSLHKSCEDVASSYAKPQIAKSATHSVTEQTARQLNGSKQLTAKTVQWPTAIPSSPSIPFPMNFQRYATASNSRIAPHHGHDLVSRTASGSAAGQGQPKIQRAYAFDEHRRRSSAAIVDTFDLDEIERERRRSHASLFCNGVGDVSLINLGVCSGGSGNTSEYYDLINGTAV